MATSTEAEGTEAPTFSHAELAKNLLHLLMGQIRRRPFVLIEPPYVDAVLKVLAFILKQNEKPLPSEGDKATIEAVQEKLNFIETLLEAKGIHITEAPGRAPRTHG